MNHGGFVARAGVINTSGIGGLETTRTPINLVALDLEENSLTNGDVYSISCKVIGSNIPRNDCLHFTSATHIHLSSNERAPIEDNDTFVNNIAMTALGTIVAKVSTDEDWGEGVYPMIVTLKSVDIDPISNEPTVWLSKHHMTPRPGMPDPSNMFKVGQEVQISGMVKGYDNVDHMWHTEVSWITGCGNQAAAFRDVMGSVCRGRKQKNSLNAHRFQQFLRRYNAKHGDPARLRLMNKGGIGAWRSRQVIERKHMRRRNSIL